MNTYTISSAAEIHVSHPLPPIRFDARERERYKKALEKLVRIIFTPSHQSQNDWLSIRLLSWGKRTVQVALHFAESRMNSETFFKEAQRNIDFLFQSFDQPYIPGASALPDPRVVEIVRGESEIWSTDDLNVLTSVSRFCPCHSKRILNHRPHALAIEILDWVKDLPFNQSLSQSPIKDLSPLQRVKYFGESFFARKLAEGIQGEVRATEEIGIGFQERVEEIREEEGIRQRLRACFEDKLQREGLEFRQKLAEEQRVHQENMAILDAQLQALKESIQARSEETALRTREVEEQEGEIRQLERELADLRNRMAEAQRQMEESSGWCIVS